MAPVSSAFLLDAVDPSTCRRCDLDLTVPPGHHRWGVPFWNAVRSGTDPRPWRAVSGLRRAGTRTRGDDASRPDRYPPALSPAQRDRIRRSREALVGGGLLADAARAAPASRSHRAELAALRRATGARGARPGSTTASPRTPASAAPRRRAGARPPPVDSLADVAGGHGALRRDAAGSSCATPTSAASATQMDRANAAEGFDFSEHSIGTNGIGTVLVERRPVLVRGPEHYNAELESLTCAGTPIFEPYTGRVVGSFSLACAPATSTR